MDVAERALAVVAEVAFVRRIGRDPDVQIMPAARLEVAELRHRTPPRSQIWPWKVRLITSCCCSGVSRTKLTA